MVRRVLVGVLVLVLAAACSDETTVPVSAGPAPPVATTAVVPVTTTGEPTTTSVVPTTTAGLATTTTTAAQQTDPLSVASIEAWGDEFATIARRVAEVWDSGDLDAFRTVYTEDIVHDDPTFGAYLEGIDSIIGMLQSMPDIPYQLTAEFSAGLIGGEGGIMVWETWDFLGFTEENRLIEVDRLTTRDGRVAYWKLYYKDREPVDTIIGYTQAWSSGDPTQVVALYDPAITRQDTVFGTYVKGTEDLAVTATEFFADHPNAGWEVLMSFDAVASQGGILSVTDTVGCPVQVAVLLSVDEGQIVYEEIYYEAASLLDCGWLD